MARLLAVAFILFCFEIGFFLIFVPWSELWESNVLLTYVPALRPIVLHQLVRVAITALGGLDLLIGLSELRHFLKSLGVRAAE